MAAIRADLWVLTKETARRWVRDECYRLAPSLAFFALSSIFPLLLLSLTVLGFVLGENDRVRGELLNSLDRAVASPASRQVLDDTLRSMQEHRTARGIGAVVGIVTTLFSASAGFSELESSLNRIWRASTRTSPGLLHSFVRAVKDRAVSFAVAAGAAVAILSSLALSAIPGFFESILSIALVAAVLAAVYRIVPRAPVAWRDVLGGALLTAVLLSLTKELLAMYFSHLAGYAAYGAAGGFLGLSLWIYVDSLVLFYGAEWTHVYAERFGSMRNMKKAS